VDQFRAYRQTGAYGGYRLAFRRWPGMTLGGNGWTPGPVALALAKCLEGRLGAARPRLPLQATADDGDGPIRLRAPKLGKGDKHQWWLKRWDSFLRKGKRAEQDTLPRPKTEFRGLTEEGRLLRPALFGRDAAGQRRLAVVRELKKTRARHHAGFLAHLARAFPDQSAVVVLPRFARLADAGMQAMDLVARVLGDKPSIAIAEIAKDKHFKASFTELIAAARAWRKAEASGVRHAATVDRFARIIPKSPKACLLALLAHHEQHGGGQRWFVVRKDRVEPRTAPGARASRYRFRLFSLGRLAVQTGTLTKMPAALLKDAALTDSRSDDYDE
jgi:hypothetical protein